MSETSLCVNPIGLIGYIFNYWNTDSQCSSIMTSPVSPLTISFWIYLKYFVTTLILEAPIYFLFFRAIEIKKLLIAVIAINLATHPFIFLVLPKILAAYHSDYFAYLLIAEIFAPIIEMCLLKLIFKTSWSKAFISALAANLFSWCVGVFLL